MPLRTHRCSDCQHRYLAFRGGPVADHDSVECPKCGSLAVAPEFEGSLLALDCVGSATSLERLERDGLLESAKRHKAWLESPEVRRDVLEGRKELALRGPRELQPDYLHTRRLF